MIKDAKPDAWMPLYVGDWDGDTGHLDCQEDGAYGRLVRYYWRNGPLPDDDRILARIVRTDIRTWRRMRPVLAAFFAVEEARWRHKRVDAEVAAWSEKRRKYIERASNGGFAKAAKSRPQAVLNACTSASASSRAEEGSKNPSSRSGRAGAAAGQNAAAPGAWPGPDDLRQAVVDQKGEAYVRAWLDPAGWRESPDRAVICRLRTAAQRLALDLRPLLAAHGVAVVTECAA